MKELKVGIQVKSMGTRCGCNTYAMRLKHYLNKLEKNSDGEDVFINAKIFAERLKDPVDIINVQYEPGLYPDPREFSSIFDEYFSCPIAVTAHHIGYLEQFYSIIDGIILHSEEQVDNKPWLYKVIPHPALVFPKKDKQRLRKKFGLPEDKKIVGTAGFITGTGKNLPSSVEAILKRLNDDEFLYLTTSFWKGGDMGRERQILSRVKKLGKEKQFKMDTDFVSDEELNERLQACDLLFAWCGVGPNDVGSQSGIAADMYGSRTKLIVKDSAHYSFIGSQDKVLVGREGIDSFADDVIDALRNEDLEDVQDPIWLSWQEKVKEYLDFYYTLIGE